jgi:hypothetical protein
MEPARYPLNETYRHGPDKGGMRNDQIVRRE